jgi:outer membrane protein TolC
MGTNGFHKRNKGRGSSAGAVVFLFVLVLHPGLIAQNAPPSSAKPWQVGGESRLLERFHTSPKPTYSLDQKYTYTLADLVDFAESHNPDTRLAWQNAKAHAQALGVSEAALFPTITAVALASNWRDGALIGSGFHRQTEGLFQPTLNLNYLIFDFGGRGGAIEEARAEMFEADFAFNDTHRRIIYQVTSGYYRLLNTIGQLDAAKATLLNANTVEQDAQSRLDHGLATTPDLLEAQAEAAQAEYDLQSAIGAEEIAQGDLATTLSLAPGAQFRVQSIDQLTIPDTITETADQAIERALTQRPDLLGQLAQVRAADASLKQARSSYFPSLSFSGIGGLQRGYGQQDLLPGSYAEGETWNCQLTLQWTLFDGARREHALAEANARRSQAQAGVVALRNQISDEVWTAYSNARTSLRQKESAAALLLSANRSYTAALKAYDFGVRNLLDVVAAQRTLAQARSADISARTQVLTQLSNLAFRTGDLLRSQPPKAGP